MSTLSSLRVRPVAPFCTASTRSVQARRMNVRAHRVGLRHGPAAITIRCRELSGPAISACSEALFLAYGRIRLFRRWAYKMLRLRCVSRFRIYPKQASSWHNSERPESCNGPMSHANGLSLFGQACRLDPNWKDGWAGRKRGALPSRIFRYYAGVSCRLTKKRSPAWETAQSRF
jgi:hypothetical protein